MSSVNRIILVGNLGADPELTHVGAGMALCKFNIATTEQWVKNGERKSKTDWHKIRVWGKFGEMCAKNLSKGRQVYVEGSQHHEPWTDDQGVQRQASFVTARVVQFLGSRPEASNRGGYNDFGPEPDFGGFPGNDFANQEIPF